MKITTSCCIICSGILNDSTTVCAVPSCECHDWSKVSQAREEAEEKPFNYSQNSHYHCRDNDLRSCGIHLEKHTQCCLCDVARPRHDSTNKDCLQDIFAGSCNCWKSSPTQEKPPHDPRNTECVLYKVAHYITIPQNQRVECTCPRLDAAMKSVIEEIGGKKCIKVDPQEFKDAKFTVRVDVSPRIDYCKRCEADHSYDCPKDADECCKGCWQVYKDLISCADFECKCHTQATEMDKGMRERFIKQFRGYIGGDEWSGAEIMDTENDMLTFIETEIAEAEKRGRRAGYEKGYQDGQFGYPYININPPTT